MRITVCPDLIEEAYRMAVHRAQRFRDAMRDLTESFKKLEQAVSFELPEIALYIPKAIDLVKSIRVLRSSGASSLVAPERRPAHAGHEDYG